MTGRLQETGDRRQDNGNLRLVLVVIAMAIFLQPERAEAFYEYKGDNSNFRGRLAIDLMSGFTHYPQPEIIYPDDTEGFNSANSRLLLDSTIAGNTRLDFNGYIYASSNEQTYFSNLSKEKDSPYRYPQLYWEISETDSSMIIGDIDQLSVKYHSDRYNLTAGRQPVSLANNFIFTPNDVFYPFSATAVDREFRPGVDALRFDYDITDLSTITALGVAGYDDNDPSWEKSAVILRGGTNVKSLDITVFAGKTDSRRLLGMTLNAEASGLGLRLEGNYSHPIEGEAHADFFQISLGIDKRWENSLHVILEYYYHGNGKSNPDQYMERILDYPDIMDPYMGRNYAGIFVMGEPSPLFKLQGVLIANLDDGSILFGPGVIYSISDEAELILGGTIPYGETSFYNTHDFALDVKSEFGLYPRSVYLLGRVYF
ncbi:MAG TPA: hypothetical protein VIS94_10355 [Desulfomonilia bacterium]